MFFLFLPMAFNFFSDIPPTSKNHILEVLKPYHSQVGLSVRELDGTEILNVNGHSELPPASVAKALSSACALHTLGPEFQFTTTYSYTGQIHHGVLDGDLVITGGGDPSYVVEDLRQDVEALQVLHGIHEIKGDLVFDLSYFGNSGFGISEGFSEDAGRSFTAALTPISLDFNSFSIWVTPRDTGADVEILPREAWQVAHTINSVKVIPNGETDVSLDYSPVRNEIRVSGKIPRHAEPKGFWRALPDAYLSFAKIFDRVWTDQGGSRRSSKYRLSNSSPKGLQSLTVHRSKSLAKMLMDINKLSTNFAAEMVGLKVGVELKGGVATAEKSKLGLETCLKDFSLQSDAARLSNASGLSRESRLQPSALTQFLSRVSTEYFWPEYLSSLSILGRDGTMKKKFSLHSGEARLKSGTLKDVVSVAGYLFPKSKKPLALALFFHCPACTNEKMHESEDRILNELLP